MSSLILPRRFNSQPQGAVALAIQGDAWPDGYHNLLGKSFSLNTSGVTVKPSPDGIAVYGAASSQNDYASIDNSYINPAGYWSASFQVKPGSRVTEWVIFSYGSAGSAPYYYFQLTVTTSGALKWYAYAGSNLTVTGSADEIPLSGRSIPVTVTYSAGVVSLYADGRLVASGTAPTGTRTDAFNKLYLFKQTYNVGYALLGYLTNLVIEPYVLDAGTIWHRHDNPWMVYSARPRVLYFDVGGGPVIGTTSIAADIGTNVASTVSKTASASIASNLSTEAAVASAKIALVTLDANLCAEASVSAAPVAAISATIAAVLGIEQGTTSEKIAIAALSAALGMDVAVTPSKVGHVSVASDASFSGTSTYQKIEAGIGSTDIAASLGIDQSATHSKISIAGIGAQLGATGASTSAKTAVSAAAGQAGFNAANTCQKIEAGVGTTTVAVSLGLDGSVSAVKLASTSIATAISADVNAVTAKVALSNVAADGGLYGVVTASPYTPPVGVTLSPEDIAAIATAVWAHGSAIDYDQLALAILAAAQITPIHADIRRVNNIAVSGAGTPETPWGP